MDLSEAEALLRARVSQKLAEHSQRVGVYAAELALRWGADPQDVLLAGWLHDLCKEMDAASVLTRARELGVPVGPIEAARPTQLLHAPVAAAELAGRGLGAACLEAIACHTTGRAGMGAAARCLYVADAAEPARTYAGVERLRELAAADLQAAVGESAAQTLTHLVRRGAPIHPSSVELYNEIHL
jgi:predicted HD superfamily hydrolase involved in NAD metabolism